MQSGLHCRGEDTVRCMAIRQEAVVSHDIAYFVLVRQALQGGERREANDAAQSGFTTIRAEASICATKPNPRSQKQNSPLIG